MELTTDRDLEVLIDKLPPHIQAPLRGRDDLDRLLEVVLDLGRVPEARFRDASVTLSESEVSAENIAYTIERIGQFGEDNRAGIERTLHRISAIRNRAGAVIGLTLRVGRAVYGTIRVIEDLIMSGKSVLLLGKPGVGKTTMLREVARVLADDAHRRVIVVDTSNEIAGDGDIPHPAIGRARRMQVPSPALQHNVMIEAVENHMPEVIIIDEIGIELDANAARTIAERGVQLVATAHGNTLDNLVMNPTLSDLVGGIQSVTLGDIEARRRRTQKTVLERRAPPTFDVLVEIQSWTEVAVHPDVADTVDRMLRGYQISPEHRAVDAEGEITKKRVPVSPGQNGIQRNGNPYADGDDMRGAPFNGRGSNGRDRRDRRNRNDRRDRDDRRDWRDERERRPEPKPEPVKITHIMPYGVNKGKLQQAVRHTGSPVHVVDDMKSADLLLTTKNYYRRKTNALQAAEQRGKPVYVLRRNTTTQIEQFIRAITRDKRHGRHDEALDDAMSEAESAANRVIGGERQVQLSPQNAYARHVQHEIAEQHGLTSHSVGKEPMRSVIFYR